jgi:hypothetical protein
MGVSAIVNLITQSTSSVHMKYITYVRSKVIIAVILKSATVCSVAWWKLTHVSVELPASIFRVKG